MERGGILKAVIYFVLAGIALFSLQLIFCLKVKPSVLKTIPSFLVLSATVLDVLLFLGYFGNTTAVNSFEEYKIEALLYGFIISGAFIGNIAAWIVSFIKGRR